MKEKDTVLKRMVCITGLFVLFMTYVMGCGSGSADGNTQTSEPGDQNIVVDATESLCINEFMSNNDTIVEDPDQPGAYEDWIEIFNSSDFEIDMGGMYLTDDMDDVQRWRVPDNVIIAAKGYLVFWADNDEDQGPLHTNFKLDRMGEAIGLFHNDANRNIPIDMLKYDEQTDDMSYGRLGDCGESWQTFDKPTPGSANPDV